MIKHFLPKKRKSQSWFILKAATWRACSPGPIQWILGAAFFLYCQGSSASPLMACGGSAAQSCLTLCNLMDGSPPGSSVHGIFQARILDFVAICSSRGSSRSRDQTRIFCISCTAGRLFTAEPPGKPHHNVETLFGSWFGRQTGFECVCMCVQMLINIYAFLCRETGMFLRQLVEKSSISGTFDSR